MTAARVVRVAVTETRNAFADMPASVGELEQLEGRLEELRAANVEHHVDLPCAPPGPRACKSSASASSSLARTSPSARTRSGLPWPKTRGSVRR